jgi:hypothetical protein
MSAEESENWMARTYYFRVTLMFTMLPPLV